MRTPDALRSYYGELLHVVEMGEAAHYRAFLRRWSETIGVTRAKALQAKEDAALAARLRYLARSLPVSPAIQTEAESWLQRHGYPLEPPDPVPHPRRSCVKRKA